MGLELILGAASLAVGVISSVSAASDRAKSAEASKTSNNITIAQGKVEALEARRSRIREERVRRAQIEQGSQNAGSSGSSGASGAVSALGTNFGTLISQQEGATKANIGINKWNQIATDFENRARATTAWGELFQSGFKTIGTIFEPKP